MYRVGYTNLKYTVFTEIKDNSLIKQPHEKIYFIINFLHVVNKKYHISPTFTLQCYLTGHLYSQCLYLPHIFSAPGSSLSFHNKPLCVGQESVVGIATGCGLDSLGIESRWGEFFRTCPDQP
jgi:hypothetical protein